VQLTGDVGIDAVLARSAPSASILRHDAPHEWTLAVPVGTEVAVRDQLRADDGVALASLGYFGYIEPWFTPGYLQPADSKYPTAGICFPGPNTTAPGATATVILRADVPTPRCVRVRPTQHLAVKNQTDRLVRINVTVTVTLEIPPGETKSLEPRFGDIWAPGVHVLRRSPGGSGPEIWLVRSLPDSAIEPIPSPTPLGLSGNVFVAVMVGLVVLASFAARRHRQPRDR
jgi:hypothetical protein